VNRAPANLHDVELAKRIISMPDAYLEIYADNGIEIYRRWFVMETQDEGYVRCKLRLPSRVTPSEKVSLFFAGKAFVEIDLSDSLEAMAAELSASPCDEGETISVTYTLYFDKREWQD